MPNFVGFVSLWFLWFFVPSYHHAFVEVQNFSSRAGISLVQNLFSWVFHGSKIFSLSVFRGSKIFPCKYFEGPKYFSVVIFWVRNSFSCVFRGPNIFYDEYFVGPKFLREGVLWVQNIFSWSFLGSIVVSHVYIIGSAFFLLGISVVRNCLFFVLGITSWYMHRIWV